MATEDRVIRISKKKFWGTVIVLVVIVALWWRDSATLGIQYQSGVFPTVSSGVSGGMSAPSISREYPDPYYGEVDITDTREFVKTSYSAGIKTRDVRSMERNVKSIIREVDGRVDGEQVSEKYASLRFVVPQDKFESFRAEIESLTHAKLYTENVSSENLLSQKQNIEGQTSNEAGYLADLQKEKKTLDSTHAIKSAAQKKELVDVVAQLAMARTKLANAQTVDERNLYQIQETTLIARESSIRQSITTENSSYNRTSASLAGKIASSEQSLTNLSQQDTDLLNNVATVRGSINIQWASWWALAVLVSPIHPTWIIVVLIILAWYILRRTGVLPRVEFV